MWEEDEEHFSVNVYREKVNLDTIPVSVRKRAFETVDGRLGSIRSQNSPFVDT